MFQIPIFILIFLTGLIVGSFLNCVIYRLEVGEGFLRGRSFCPHCKHQLSWQDLIPIFSFLILKGKCRYCQKKISWQYPLVEFITGSLFLLIWYAAVIKISEFLFLALISSFLIIIFVYDLKHYIIPDKVIYPAIAIALIFNFLPHQIFGGGFNQFSIFKFSILSAFGAALFFLMIVLVSRGKWMGVGDIKLAFLMGLVLGFPNILVALFLAFFIGAIIGIGLITTGKKTLKSEVPFGPFLVTGTFVALFWGESLVNWYLNLFNLTI
jgi:prepilin signal peptidase PulO-like enzyme (type II secretory pathway)